MHDTINKDDYGTGFEAANTPYICAECGANDIHLVPGLMDERIVWCPYCGGYVDVLEFEKVQ